MSEAVFIGRNGQQLGPYSRAQLEGMAGRGEILPGDLLWHQGMPGWQPAAEVLAGMGITVVNLPPRLPPGDIPISRGGAPAAAPGGPMTQKDMYEAFIGPEKSGYYVPVFEGFDQGGSAASWNTPAALITQWWMLYRGMFLWGFLFYPALSWIVSITVTLGLSAISPVLAGLGPWLVILGSVVVMGLYSNKIYHGHVNKLIERSGKLGLSDQLRREWLIRKGATSYIWIIFVFVGIAMIGILAAIAIPAYQDYVIRSQVSEGAALADGAKTAVAEYYNGHHAMPATNTDAGLAQPDSISGKYVQQVQVVDGVIVVTYGGVGANPRIQGNVLAYVPEETGAGAHLIWHCNTERTTLPNKYRPQVCRN